MARTEKAGATVIITVHQRHLVSALSAPAMSCSCHRNDDDKGGLPCDAKRNYPQSSPVFFFVSFSPRLAFGTVVVTGDTVNMMQAHHEENQK